MNNLLTKLQQDIRVRGLSPTTEGEYIMNVELFLKWLGKAKNDIIDPSELTEQDFRNYLEYLINDCDLAPATVNIYNSSLRFFFGVTLDQNINYRQVPRLKQRRSLPEILTREELSDLFDSCDNLRDKAVLMLLYGSGLRLSELTNLKVADIDSKSMRLFVNHGKGGKDRYTILSESCLLVLREYWKSYKPQEWLFNNRSKDSNITCRAVQDILKKYIKKTGITKKNISIHTLRHCFATHLLENGVSIIHIKKLMGHTHIQSTTFYLHLTNIDPSLKSPLDALASPKPSKKKKNSKKTKNAEVSNA